MFINDVAFNKSVFQRELSLRYRKCYISINGMYTFTFLSHGPAATLSLGERMGVNLRAGSVITLTGELGCGKTLFTRGICTGLGVPLRQVNSPTFVLVNEYRGRLPVFHMDMYQLGAASDAVEFGFFDYLARAASGIMIIEWAEKINGVLPDDCLNVKFDILSARKRQIALSASGNKFMDLFRELSKP
jgi:tRNA threonylcarbamoyladenosine biosynthesis protein TsaE